MKKHDEGYILAYVTVVLMVFCLVATVILTGALQNLQSQQNTIAQMQDQYAAEGMIEKVVAQWGSYDFVQGNKVGDTDVMCIAKDDTTVTLYAESGTVSITCKMKLSDGAYYSYEVSTITPAEDEEVPQ